MFLENLNRIVPVEEAYVGKQPNILAMEKCIDRLRKKYYEKMENVCNGAWHFRIVVWLDSLREFRGKGSQCEAGS